MGNRNSLSDSGSRGNKSKQEPSWSGSVQSPVDDQRQESLSSAQGSKDNDAPPRTAHPYGQLFGCALLLWAVQLGYLALAPYSKVEESFNMQAIHDLLFLGVKDTSQYDHHTFPGVVPRTFLGALTVSWFASPVLWTIRRVLGVSSLVTQKIIMLYAARAILGLLVTLSHLSMSISLFHLSSSLSMGVLYLLITAAQFHTTFWATRTLPNTFALIPTTLALAAAYNRCQPNLPRTTTTLFAIAGLIFRSELILLAGPLYLLALIKGTLKITPRFLLRAFSATVGSILLTLAVDSYFWHTPWMWPELQVLLFNTLHNQSHLWGTQPWYAYAAWHVPKLVMGGMPWIAVGARQSTVTREWLMVAASFVGLYSLLPHKETRFIIYTVPFLNACAATGMSWAWATVAARSSSLFHRLLIRLLVVGSIVGSLAASFTMAVISSYNYPGGDALRYLATSESPLLTSVKTRVVHVDVYSAQTGASRFLEDPRRWVYNKSEAVRLEELMDNAKVGARIVRWEDWEAEKKNGGGPEEVQCFRCLARVDPVGMGERLVRRMTGSVQDSNLELGTEVTAVWGLVRLKPCVCLIRN